MLGRYLKWMRVAVAVAVFLALLVAWVDFREVVPAAVGQTLGAVQLVPSLVALVTGASLSLAGLVLLLLTLGGGRIYCSTLCPLGIGQDIVIRVRRWFDKKRALPFAPPVPWLRPTMLGMTILASSLGWGGFVLALLDPYSNFGRIAAGIFRPLTVFVNNQLVGLMEAWGGHGLYRVDPAWLGAGALLPPLLVLVGVTALAFWRERLFCNTLCPVGALLGSIARRAAFRLAPDPAACRACDRCARVCKAQCLDARAGTIDFSRCVACLNCLAVCDQGGIGYRFAWRRPAPRVGRSEAAANPQRRDFLKKSVLGVVALGLSGRAFAAGAKPVLVGPRPDNWTPAVSPPGSGGVAAFLQRCTACHLCVSACPTGVLRPATLEFGLRGFLKPRLDFVRAFCTLECRRCGEVCPTGAIRLPDMATKRTTKIGEVEFFRAKCVVVTKGTDCAACSEHCPTQAVTTRPYGVNLRLPAIHAERCIGCGACEHVCPVKPDKAIQVRGFYRHGVAQKFSEPKVTAPAARDFSF